MKPHKSSADFDNNAKAFSGYASDTAVHNMQFIYLFVLLLFLLFFSCIIFS